MAKRRLFFIIFTLFCFVSAATIGSGEAWATSGDTRKINSAAAAKAKKTASQKTASKKTASKKSASKTTAAKKRLKKSYNARASSGGDKFAAVVVDAATGQVLYEKNASGLRYPASLTKMMTLYLTFDALKKGKLRMDQHLRISELAMGQPQTNIHLSQNSALNVKTAIEALVVRSANDVSYVLAEQLGGTTWNFAQMMTQKARELGMKDTVFRNPNGLPDDGQYTNAYDMARLGIALRRDFPEYYKYFKTERFDFEGVTYTTHNRVMLRYDGVDGIKTGYIRASGFNLVTSVKKDGYNLVAVVMGGTSATARDDLMISLLDRTFADLATNGHRLAQSSSLNVAPEVVAN